MEDCVEVEVCVESDVDLVCTIMLKKMLRYAEYPKADTIAMELGVEEATDT